MLPLAAAGAWHAGSPLARSMRSATVTLGLLELALSTCTGGAAGGGSEAAHCPCCWLPVLLATCCCYLLLLPAAS